MLRFVCASLVWADARAQEKRGSLSAEDRLKGMMHDCSGGRIPYHARGNRQQAVAGFCDAGTLRRIIETEGPDIDEGNDNGQTPLHHATVHGNDGTLKVLLEAGADLSARDIEGRQAIHHAALLDRTGILLELLRHGAEVDSVCSCSAPDLGEYRRQSRLRYAEGGGVIVRLYPPVDPRRTPLHLAVASREARTEAGETPLDLASSNEKLRDSNVLELLEGS